MFGWRASALRATIAITNHARIKGSLIFQYLLVSVAAGLRRQGAGSQPGFSASHERPTLPLWDCLQILSETLTVYLTQIILIEVEFATANGPSVNVEHFTGFDPPGRPVNEDFIAARRHSASPLMCRQVGKPGESRVIRHSRAPSPGGVVEVDDHIRREHP